MCKRRLLGYQKKAFQQNLIGVRLKQALERGRGEEEEGGKRKKRDSTFKKLNGTLRGFGKREKFFLLPRRHAQPPFGEAWSYSDEMKSM